MGVEEVTVVLDLPIPVCTMRCTLILTQKRTPQVSTTLFLWPHKLFMICDYEDFPTTALFIFYSFLCGQLHWPEAETADYTNEWRAAVRPWWGRQGPGVGWCQAETVRHCKGITDGENNYFSTLCGHNQQNQTFILVILTFFVGTTAKNEQPQRHSHSLLTLRLYPTAMLSSIVLPAWRLSAWTVRGENSLLKEDLCLVIKVDPVEVLHNEISKLSSQIIWTGSRCLPFI